MEVSSETSDMVIGPLTYSVRNKNTAAANFICMKPFSEFIFLLSNYGIRFFDYKQQSSINGLTYIITDSDGIDAFTIVFQHSYYCDRSAWPSATLAGTTTINAREYSFVHSCDDAFRCYGLIICNSPQSSREATEPHSRPLIYIDPDLKSKK